MVIPDSVIDLAGFTLGHALWNVCDFEEEDELLCPLAITFDGQQQQLLRFEAGSQEEAIERAYSTLADRSFLVEWALAREGLFKSAGGPIDVLLVDAWARGLDEPVVFAQPFSPAASGRFRLLGRPEVYVSGQASTDPSLTERLKRGVLSHQEAAELWPSWKGW